MGPAHQPNAVAPLPCPEQWLALGGDEECAFLPSNAPYIVLGPDSASQDPISWVQTWETGYEMADIAARAFPATEDANSFMRDLHGRVAACPWQDLEAPAAGGLDTTLVQVRVLTDGRILEQDVAEPIDGFVVLVGERWALVAATRDGGYFDGYIACRLRDVVRVGLDKTFASSHASLQPAWPPTSPPGVRGDSMVDVLEGLGAGGALVGIQKEHERSALWIGRLDEIRKKHVYLREVRPDGSWHGAPLGYALRSTTAIETVSRYLRALEASSSGN